MTSAPQCLCEQCEMTVQQCRERATTSAERVLDELPKLSSTELMLIAHDEWKNRMERKHLFEEEPWVSGWINGFMTSRKWVNERVQKLRAQRGRDLE